MRLITFVVLLTSLFFMQSRAITAETPESEVISTALKGVFPKLDISRIKKSRIEGLYEVVVGPDVLYVTGDGRYLLKGDLLDLKNRINISEEQRSSARVDILRNIPVNEVIEFSPKKAEHAVYVFTDTDCGYCRKLHRDVPELNKRGIAVRYLAYPRGGVGSKTFNDMEAVWCAADQKQAMTDAKSGKNVEQKSTCSSPVSKHYALGQAMGVRGTPAIFLENGREMPGYLPPNEIFKAVNRSN